MPAFARALTYMLDAPCCVRDNHSGKSIASSPVSVWKKKKQLEITLTGQAAPVVNVATYSTCEILGDFHSLENTTKGGVHVRED